MVGDEDTLMEQIYIRNILAEIESALVRFRELFAGRLRGGMLELAQAAADRERRVLEIVGPIGAGDPLLERDMTETVSEPGGLTRTVQYGRVAHDAVDALATRYYGDGLKLSDRLYGMDKVLRSGVEDTMLRAVIEGLSVEQTMDRLVGGPLSATSEAAHYAARIARTEIAHAYSEASIGAVTDPGTHRMRDGVTGVRWQLSTSHPASDICDIWALHDSGAGPGVYSNVDAMPIDHPNGLCYWTTVLADVPATAAWTGGQTPDITDIPDSQITRYADAGDHAAQALLAGR